MKVPHEFPEMEQYVASIGHLIKEHMPEGCGFALLMFTFGEGGSLSYCGNGEREDIIKVMREFIDAHEQGEE